MATVGQFVRAYGAAVRRSERDQQRRAREAAKNHKLQVKSNEIANATDAVRKYDEYLEILLSIHKNCNEPIDWNIILNEPKPEEPKPIEKRQKLAKKNLENYKPSFFDKMLGMTKKKTERLKEELEISIKEDKAESIKKHNEFEENETNWNSLQNIANKVINKNAEGYKLAIEYFGLFDDLGELGSELSLKFQSDKILATAKVKSKEIVPTYSLSQTSTGKLTKKDLTQSKYNELYQDYVCSVVLRVSRELLANFPLKFVIVDATSEMLNSKTGHVEEQIILSVAIPPKTLEKLNFETIDPLDSMKNFIHNMKFTKASGFSHVEQITFEQ